MRMNNHGQWPHRDTRRCGKMKSGRRYKIDQNVCHIGSCKMAQHLTRPIPTLTSWQKWFEEEWYPVNLNPLDFCVWGYIKDQVWRIQQNQLHNCYVQWKMMHKQSWKRWWETQLKMCANMGTPASRLPAVILGTWSRYPKNADSQLSSHIFLFKIHSLLTE